MYFCVGAYSMRFRLQVIENKGSRSFPKVLNRVRVDFAIWFRLTCVTNGGNKVTRKKFQVRIGCHTIQWRSKNDRTYVNFCFRRLDNSCQLLSIHVRDRCACRRKGKRSNHGTLYPSPPKRISGFYSTFCLIWYLFHVCLLYSILYICDRVRHVRLLNCARVLLVNVRPNFCLFILQQDNISFRVLNRRDFCVNVIFRRLCFGIFLCVVGADRGRECLGRGYFFWGGDFFQWGRLSLCAEGAIVVL